MPGPIFALACGEPGIAPFLQRSRGDKVLEIYSDEDFLSAIDFATENSDQFASIAIDNVHIIWELFREAAEDRNGRELRGRDWATLKKPWKKWLRKIMRTPQNVMMTTQIQDILYTTEEGMPGQQAQTKIYQQDNPHTEKNVPYVVDLIFKCEKEKDKLFKPTGWHRISFYGGRVPINVSPKDLFTGKFWRFDSKKDPRENPWNVIIEPFKEKWIEGSVEYMGLDPMEAEMARGEVKEAFDQAETTRLLEEIAACKTPQEAKDKWDKDWGKVYSELNEARRALVDKAKAEAKARWMGGK